MPADRPDVSALPEDYTTHADYAIAMPVWPPCLPLSARQLGDQRFDPSTILAADRLL
jgi:hypothetical protein